MNRLLTLIICALAATSLQAQEQVATIADRINASGVATVSQPARLNARLATATDALAKAEDEASATTATPRSTGGYRIQLFSGNNARTAKNEASNRAAQIDAQFPEYASYVSYDAPYWRLKVGDFRNYEEASAALTRLKAAMPSYAREMRVVRDRINTRE